VCGDIPETGFVFDYANLNISVTLADEQMTHEILVKIIPEVEKNDDDEDTDLVERK
jgi:hypothetical protein